MESLKHRTAFSGFAVKDLDAARKFYADTLGLDVKEDAMHHLNLQINNGQTMVLIYPKPDHQPAVFTVLNFTVENIDETVDALTAKGVKFQQYGPPIQTDAKGIVRGGKPLVAWFTDPSGNIISVLQM
ncbi:glyoxalase [Chitinophaga parva]|uniref:Glyoxalase n=1 Tax=Chitinophaga parva TaxID=2169414 RepID=A0A2T7BEE7_9BACT|nr:VOC family protein [Chitinophaga parva]PUZ23457.1 glyoxalase [Chitinophaga parva]